MNLKVLFEEAKLDREGQVKEQEQRLYRNVPIRGVPYSRLEEINNRPLTEDELEDERKRERKFRERLAKGKDPQGEDEQSVHLDEDLVQRDKPDTAEQMARRLERLIFDRTGGRTPDLLWKCETLRSRASYYEVRIIL